MQWVTAQAGILTVFATSAMVSAVIFLARGLYMPLIERRRDAHAVQAAHKTPTPRIGGLAILVSLAPAFFLLEQDIRGIFLILCVSLLPIVIAGLLEDLGQNVRPLWRLLAASASSALAIAMLGMTIPRADLPVLNEMLEWMPFAWVFTIFACAGICNAFNLIDGLNGLSGSVGLVCAAGLGAIATQSGDASMTGMSLMLVAGLTGFLSFNYPWGRIFLGDVGAYALGHLLAWFAIVLMVRVPGLSAWAVLLIFFWPVADTSFAIYRRWRAGRPTGSPDRLHFHQLVMRAVEITLIGRGRRHIANPLATLIMTPVFVSPVLMGVWLWDKPVSAFAALCLCAGLFVASYLTGMRVACKWRRTGVRRSDGVGPLQARVGTVIGIEGRTTR
jgi:UDP-GlcNAc:undecaprenyl-phosphate/decaprenyl-phosphate GlcNAc-1-phosphate transferase